MIAPAQGWKIHKTKTSLTFRIKVIDPNAREQDPIITEFFINDKRVETFTAKDLDSTNNPITNVNYGQLLTPESKNFEITLPIEGKPDYFTLKALVTDKANTTGEQTASVEYRNINPSLSFPGLDEKQKIPKHNKSITFNMIATDPDDVDENSLKVEFYLIPTKIGEENIAENNQVPLRVNNFTAEDTEVENGILANVKSGSPYKITIDKSVLPLNVNEFILKGVVSDTSNDTGKKEISLLHDNKLPTIEIIGLTDGEKIEKAKNILEFTLKADDENTLDANLVTAIYLGVPSGQLVYYEQVTEFSVDGILNTQGQFTAEKGKEYQITLNKFAYVPINAPEFILKVEAQDTCGEKGKTELTLVHSTDILAQWCLDAIKEGLTTDDSGNNNHGIVYGATLATGVIDNSLCFDGVNDYISIPRANLNNRSDWSLEAWIKPEGPGYIYAEGNPETTMVIEILDDNSLNIGTWHEEKVGNWEFFNTGAATLTRDTWNHLVVTLENGDSALDSGTVNCHVNGVLVKSDALGKAYHPTTTAATLGGNIGVSTGQDLTPFTGCLDEVTLYGYALTAGDIKNRYEKIVYVKDLTMTNRHDDNTKHRSTFGLSMTKLDFELKKTVHELVIELELPSSIKIKEVLEVFQKNDQGTYVSIVPMVGTPPKPDPEKISVTEDGIITFTQLLEPGNYRVELLLNIDENLIIKSKAFYDESKIRINCEEEIFRFEFYDFDDLPNLM